MNENLNKLMPDGYTLLSSFISESEISQILKKLGDFESNPPKYRSKVLDCPMVTLFVAGYKEEQIVIDLEDFKEVKDVVNKISKDVKTSNVRE